MFPESSEVILSANEVSIDLSGRRVLRDISFCLTKGESLALLGRNGSGKTTLLKLLAGLIEPKSGEIFVNGNIGMVFQNPDIALFGATVEENLAFSLQNLGLSVNEIRARVDDTLERFDLLALRSRDILSLSGGERQRISLACALISNPLLLLLDEPFSMIDREEGRKIARMVGGEVQRGTSVILGTNRFSEVSGYNRFVILGRNSIVFDGDRAGLIQNRDIFHEAGMPIPFELELKC
jgi:energy-coupling factor transporter ATP-binding protein EcfA2